MKSQVRPLIGLAPDEAQLAWTYGRVLAPHHLNTRHLKRRSEGRSFLFAFPSRARYSPE